MDLNARLIVFIVSAFMVMGLVMARAVIGESPFVTIGAPGVEAEETASRGGSGRSAGGGRPRRDRRRQARRRAWAARL